MKICKKIDFIRKFNIEAIVWLSAFIYLLLINPYSTNHFSFCIYRFLGFDFCPGCGLGLSISYLLHLDFINSWHSHYFGIPAFIIITHRIFVLFKLNIKELKITKFLKTKELVND
jgi:hypothetical protein